MIGPFDPKFARIHVPIAKAVNAGQDRRMTEKQNTAGGLEKLPLAKVPFEIDDYVARTRTDSCFICELVAGNASFKHHIVWENKEFIAFLNKYPTLPGYLIVCPKEHIEDYAVDMELQSYLRLQTLIHKISNSLKGVFDAERIYQLSLGSLQGNSHVHFHVAPLPKGVPYEKQQYHALMAENGILRLSEEEFATMAEQIGLAIGEFELGS
ncbi:hypothetical protein GCM10007879_23640 [Maritalea porphyrae]|uniref:HIT domain-containing protein n=2 Tax=Maritalea porphyrae TaxID=880732 RepID=A0ABQ5UTS2_9HYPH|nr:hypothetical protein GCM10007879_23640 [Maritalea porphyrae]